MKKVVRILTGVALLASATAFAAGGINPSNPGLPLADATGGMQNVAKNGGSAMCVDCHTVNPKGLLNNGTHFVNASTDIGNTSSGGSGIGSSGSPNYTKTAVVRDAGQYYKTNNWVGLGYSSGTTSAPSKYRYTGNVSVIKQQPVLNNVAMTMNASTATFDSTLVAGSDIICESCHNIVFNMNGGNNLLNVQLEWQDTQVANICVGCHGFMYTDNATGNAGNDNWASTNNDTDFGTSVKRGNNEVHWVLGVAYPQNHHVMTGDDINALTAGQRLLWTDNDVVSYSRDPMTNTAPYLGTYPQKATWLNSLEKPTADGLSCTNCHTPAHGQGGSRAASILRNATYTSTNNPASPWIGRLSDRAALNGGAVQFKKINDLVYCGQCHGL